MTTQRLSALDAAFLNFESEHEPMHVASLYIFEGKPELPNRPGVPGLFETIEQRLSLLPRYRQRIQNVPGGLGHPVWVDDPDFDLAYHLRRLAVPKPGGTTELLDVVARIHSRILDRNRPLWEMYIIEGLEGGRVAIYAKTHHAMVDGVSYVDVATIIFDFDPVGWTAPPAEPFRPRRLLSPGELVGDVVREAAGALVDTAGGMLRRPTRAPVALASQAWKATHVGELFSMLRPTPAGPLNVKVGSARRIQLVPVPLARVKAIKNALGGTVNDVVLTVVGEAIHAFLDHRGETIPEDLTYRILVPVSVRGEADSGDLGNRVSAMFLDMPVGRMPARRRLQIVMREMGAHKDKQQSVASEQLQALVARVPASLHALAGRAPLASQRFINMVVSNVPGVQVQAYAGGARLIEAYPLLPVVGNLSVVVCVASYNGGMFFGIVGDYDGFPDLEVLGRGIEGGVQNLERAAGARPPKRVARPPGRSVKASRPATNGAHRPRAKKTTRAKVSRASVREAARAAATIARSAAVAPARRPLG